MSNSNTLKSQFIKQCEQTGQKAFSILLTRPERAIADAFKSIKEDQHGFDVVLFDLPGTINTDGVFYTISMLDYLFIPIKADKMVVESSIIYAKVIQEQLLGKASCNIKQMYFYWTLIDKRERTQLYDQYAKILTTLRFNLMRTRIPARSKFSREPIGSGPMYRSTLFAPDSAFVKECRLDALAQEIYSIIKPAEPCHEE